MASLHPSWKHHWLIETEAILGNEALSSICQVSFHFEQKLVPHIKTIYTLETNQLNPRAISLFGAII